MAKLPDPKEKIVISRINSRNLEYVKKSVNLVTHLKIIPLMSSFQILALKPDKSNNIGLLIHSKMH